MKTEYVRKWPKLNPGEQIRIKNKLTGQYAFKPKGSSSGWRWHDTKATVWDNFTGPGHILGQFTKFEMNKDQKYPVRYNHASQQVLAPGIESVEIEIVTFTVIRTIDAAEQYEERKRAIQDEEYRRNTRDLTRWSGSDLIDSLVKAKGDIWFRSFLVAHHINVHIDVSSLNVGRLTIQKEQVKFLEKRILESL